MADIPEHLLKRAQQARARLTGDEATGGGDSVAGADAGRESELVGAGAPVGGSSTGSSTAGAAAGSAADTGKIPAHLLDRTAPLADRPQTEVAVPTATAPPAGSAGNTQRLLTVVTVSYTHLTLPTNREV